MFEPLIGVEDFNKALSSMTDCRFRMDISFLALMINQLKIQNKLVGNDEDNEGKFKEAVDDVFQDIIFRNFKKCTTDPRYLYF